MSFYAFDIDSAFAACMLSVTYESLQEMAMRGKRVPVAARGFSGEMTIIERSFRETARFANL